MAVWSVCRESFLILSTLTSVSIRHYGMRDFKKTHLTGTSRDFVLPRVTKGSWSSSLFEADLSTPWCFSQINPHASRWCFNQRPGPPWNSKYPQQVNLDTPFVCTQYQKYLSYHLVWKHWHSLLSYLAILKDTSRIFTSNCCKKGFLTVRWFTYWCNSKKQLKQQTGKPPQYV